MLRLLLLLLPLALMACNTVPKMFGEGPLLISHTLGERIAEYDRDLRFRNVSIAIDKDSRNVSLTYCPALGDCSNSLDGSVVEHCNKGGRYDCAILMQDDEIVWRGPVYVLHKPTSQVLPYSGRWQMSYQWTAVGDGDVESRAHFGKVRTGLIGSAGECLISFLPTIGSTGTADIRCVDGVAAKGSFELEARQVLRISAIDNEGRKLRFEMRLSAGQAETG